MIRFLCYYCQAVLKTPDEKVGRTINCPRCRKQLRVPAAPEQAKTAKMPAVPAGGSVMRKRTGNFVKHVVRLGAALVLLGGGVAVAWHYLDPRGNQEEEQQAGDQPKVPALGKHDLLTELNSPNEEIAYGAAVTLLERDDAGGIDALSAYLRMLQNQSTDKRATEMRDMALEALSKIAPLLKEGEESGVVSALTMASNDIDPNLRLRAIKTLGSLGQVATPALIDIIKDKRNKDNRLKAAEVLWSMKDQLAGRVPEMLGRLILCDRDAKVLVSSAIVKARPATPEVLPHLLEGLKTSDEEIRLIAILAIGDMGPTAKEAANALFDVGENDPIVNVQNRAKEVYAKLRALQTKKPKGKP